MARAEDTQAIFCLQDVVDRELENATDVIWDIETGPLPEDRLRELYTEKTYEEFAESCDKRWKPNTVSEKYEASRFNDWEAFVSKAALHAIRGYVVAIGYQIVSNDGPDRVVIRGGDERQLLEHFFMLFNGVALRQLRLTGFNIEGFDLPFLCRRAMLLDIEVPQSIRVNNSRYWNPCFTDLMKVWGCGDYKSFISMNDLSHAFGLEGKNGSGAEFHRLWTSGDATDRQAAIDYLRNDLYLTRELALRMGVVI